jgi:hypothetical protein
MTISRLCKAFVSRLLFGHDWQKQKKRIKCTKWDRWLRKWQRTAFLDFQTNSSVWYEPNCIFSPCNTFGGTFHSKAGQNTTFWSLRIASSEMLKIMSLITTDGTFAIRNKLSVGSPEVKTHQHQLNQSIGWQIILIDAIVSESSSPIKIPESESQEKCGLTASLPMVSIAFAREWMIDTTVLWSTDYTHLERHIGKSSI